MTKISELKPGDECTLRCRVSGMKTSNGWPIVNYIGENGEPYSWTCPVGPSVDVFDVKRSPPEIVVGMKVPSNVPVEVNQMPWTVVFIHEQSAVLARPSVITPDRPLSLILSFEQIYNRLTWNWLTNN